VLCAVLVFTIGKYQSGAGLRIENVSIYLKKDFPELAKDVIKNRHLKDQKSIIQANTFGLIQIAHNGFGFCVRWRFKPQISMRKRMLNIAINVKRSTAPPLLPNVC